MRESERAGSLVDELALPGGQGAGVPGAGHTPRALEGKKNEGERKNEGMTDPHFLILSLALRPPVVRRRAYAHTVYPSRTLVNPPFHPLPPYSTAPNMAGGAPPPPTTAPPPPPAADVGPSSVPADAAQV
jgi:hypothetical protein